MRVNTPEQFLPVFKPFIPILSIAGILSTMACSTAVHRIGLFGEGEGHSYNSFIL